MNTDGFGLRGPAFTGDDIKERGFYLSDDPGNINNAGNIAITAGQRLLIGKTVSGQNYDDFSMWNVGNGYVDIPATARWDVSGFIIAQPSVAPSPNSYASLGIVNMTTGQVICANTTFYSGQLQLVVSCAKEGVPLAINDQIGLYIVINVGATIVTDPGFTVAAAFSVQKKL